MGKSKFPSFRKSKSKERSNNANSTNGTDEYPNPSDLPRSFFDSEWEHYKNSPDKPRGSLLRVKCQPTPKPFILPVTVKKLVEVEEVYPIKVDPIVPCTVEEWIPMTDTESGPSEFHNIVPSEDVTSRVEVDDGQPEDEQMDSSESTIKVSAPDKTATEKSHGGVSLTETTCPEVDNTIEDEESYEGLPVRYPTNQSEILEEIKRVQDIESPKTQDIAEYQKKSTGESRLEDQSTISSRDHDASSKHDTNEQEIGQSEQQEENEMIETPDKKVTYENDGGYVITHTDGTTQAYDRHGHEKEILSDGNYKIWRANGRDYTLHSKDGSYKRYIDEVWQSDYEFGLKIYDQNSSGRYKVYDEDGIYKYYKNGKLLQMGLDDQRIGTISPMKYFPGVDIGFLLQVSVVIKDLFSDRFYDFFDAMLLFGIFLIIINELNT